jgi:hypothetical protein
MTTFYSNHFGPAVGATGHFTTKNSIPTQIEAGIGHSRSRHKMAQMTVPSGQDLGDGDIIRLCDLPSNARVLEVLMSMDANWGTTTTFHVGLYKKGDNDDGVVLDVDLFAATQDWAGAIARVDQFKLGVLDDWDRGKYLWQLAAIGAASYTEDPKEMWTLALTTTQDISAAAAAVEFLAEVIYIAGD